MYSANHHHWKGWLGGQEREHISVGTVIGRWYTDSGNGVVCDWEISL
jgi:hypothetical protein